MKDKVRLGSIEPSRRKLWDDAEKNKKGTLYRARVKFDRAVKFDGSKKSVNAIKDLVMDTPIEFGKDFLVHNGFQYPTGVLVCINLFGEVSFWDEETFNCLFEPIF